MVLSKKNQRISAIGKLGESLAENALKRNGFKNVQNLNEIRNNHPYGDILAEKRGKKYIISVKTRNEKRDNGALNESYNCIKVADATNKKLKSRGKTATEITKLAFDQVEKISSSHNAIPAWAAIPIRPEQGTYSVYFGLLQDLEMRRSIPMTRSAIEQYECLIEWEKDKRITLGLSNKK